MKDFLQGCIDESIMDLFNEVLNVLESDTDIKEKVNEKLSAKAKRTLNELVGE